MSSLSQYVRLWLEEEFNVKCSRKDVLDLEARQVTAQNNSEALKISFLKLNIIYSQDCTDTVHVLETV